MKSIATVHATSVKTTGWKPLHSPFNTSVYPLTGLNTVGC